MTAWPGLEKSKHVTRSGVTTTMTTNLTDATAHVYETLNDSGSHTATAPHVHDDSDSELIVMPSVNNLVADAHPQQTRAHDDVDSWARSGVGVTGDGLKFTATGQRATHLLGDQGLKAQFAGCDMVLGLLVRTHLPMTALTFRFGITDGNTSTFASGCQAEADETQVPAGGYRRLYTIIRDFDSTAFSNDVRVGVVTTGTYTTSGTVLDVTAVVAMPCSILPRWTPGYYVLRQHDWELIGTNGIPVFDDEGFSKALYLAPS